jgi:hypothetical protein
MLPQNPGTGRNYLKLTSRRTQNGSQVNGQSKTPGNGQEFPIKQQKTRRGQPNTQLISPQAYEATSFVLIIPLGEVKLGFNIFIIGSERIL